MLAAQVYHGGPGAFWGQVRADWIAGASHGCSRSRELGSLRSVGRWGGVMMDFCEDNTEPFEFEPVTDPPFNADDVATDEGLGETCSIRFTVIEAHGTRLSKEYTARPDGSGVDDDGGTQLQYGSYEVVSFDASTSIPAALAEIGPLLESLRPFEAIMSWIPKDGSKQGKIASRGVLAKEGMIALTRTLDDFSWPSGVGLLFCDGDGIDGLYGLLCGYYPPFADVAALVRPSASASVVNPATGKAFKRGEHLYAVIDDVSRSKDCLKALLRMAWKRGEGWLMLGKDGHVHVRGPVDVTVGSPERLSYEGAAWVNKGLSTLPRLSQVIGGGGMVCAKDLLAYADQVAPKAEVDALIEAEKVKPEFVALNRAEESSQARLRQEGSDQGKSPGEGGSEGI